jgi:hypothetical protein
MNSVRCIVLFLLVMISFSVRAFQSTSRRLASSPSTVRSRSDTRRALTTDIYIVGKKTGGEEWIASGIEEYEKRLRPVMTCKTIFLKTDDELIKALVSSGCVMVYLLRVVFVHMCLYMRSRPMSYQCTSAHLFDVQSSYIHPLSVLTPLPHCFSFDAYFCRGMFARRRASY